MAATYRRAAHVAWRRIGDETVCVNLATKEMVGLDPAGGAVLERCAEPRSAGELLSLFAPGAGAEPGALAAFCAELADLGLLVPLADTSGDTAEKPGAEGAIPWGPPRVLWHEPLSAVVNQISPPQQLGNPECGF
ncbi:MAG: hypothetical protein KJ058_10200 [Thermoanaerobaculia bacterium]|nr:hypothetical protein [Thermoanaerobaculia bacterium]